MLTFHTDLILILMRTPHDYLKKGDIYCIIFNIFLVTSFFLQLSSKGEPQNNNATSGSSHPPPPPPPPPPGPPPSIDLFNKSKDDMSQDRSALFDQLNQGEAITKGKQRDKSIVV